MSTGPTDARPLQVRVADDIRAKIETGEYAPGQQLPTYDALAEAYLCSLAVIRKAVDLLKQQGLLITEQGKGTFVRKRAKARRHGTDRYSRGRWSSGTAILIAEAAQQGLEASQHLRFLGTAPAPPDVAERLGIEEGAPAHVRRRTTYIDGRPNQLADSYYTLAIAEAVPALKDEDTGPGGGFARIEEAGYQLARIREEITLRMPVGPEISVLELREGTPVADLIRTAYDEQGRPLEVMVAVIAGDMVTFNYDFPVPD